MDKISYRSDMLIEKLKGLQESKVKKDFPPNRIVDFIDQYISENELTRARGSLMVYKSLKKYLQGYVSKMRTNLTFDKIDYSFMKSFQNFLINWEVIKKNQKS